MLRNARFHCGGNAKRLVNAPKVVVHEVQRHGALKVVNFLAKSVGQPGKPAHPHPHGQEIGRAHV